jgi:hypothetical protein
MAPPPAFTIGTLVTRPDLYQAMRRSFEAAGFKDDVEWLTIDNTGSQQTDAYRGLNQILSQAAGTMIILCHQDLVVLDDGRQKLDAVLADLTIQHPHWALAGNAGGTKDGAIVRRISDLRGDNQNVGSFPHAVVSLDENFLIVRGGTRVGFSADLSGFHFYGADICLIADMLGYSSWVIDFHLRHLGVAHKGPDFYACEKAFRQKWDRALRDRRIQTTCACVHLSGGWRPLFIRAAPTYISNRLRGWRRSLAKRTAARK